MQICIVSSSLDGYFRKFIEGSSRLDGSNCMFIEGFDLFFEFCPSRLDGFSVLAQN
jgi:hypothetical protein